MSKLKAGSANWAASNQKNSGRLKVWSSAWVLSIALATFGPRMIWNFEPLLTTFSVIITVVVGFGMIVATKRYLSGLDEMHQKIFRDAAVLTLGVGLVCGNSYELLEDVRLISFEPEISHLIILMCLTFLVGMKLGHRQYR